MIFQGIAVACITLGIYVCIMLIKVSFLLMLSFGCQMVVLIKLLLILKCIVYPHPVFSPLHSLP